MVGKNKETPFEIGLNGTMVEFYQAHWKAGTKGPFGLYPWHGKGRQELQRGAVQAFLEGRPGNLQTFLANGFGVYDGECHDYEILSQLIEGKDSVKTAAIISTAIAKFSKQEKKKFLDEHLLNSVDGPNNRPELAAALLKAGADPNVEFTGIKGAPLARAVLCMPLSVIELLYKKGASFDDACAYMKDECWGPGALEKLDDARQAITGNFNVVSAAKTAAPEEKPQPLVLDQEVVDAIAALEVNRKSRPRAAVRAPAL